MAVALVAGRVARQEVIDFGFEHAFFRIKIDNVAVTHPADRTIAERLRGDVDRSGSLAAGTRHAAIGDKGHFEAFVLEHSEGRGQLVELRHAVGSRALETQHSDEIALKLTGFELLEEFLLGVEDNGRCTNFSVLRVHGRSLDDTLAKIALKELEAPLGREGLLYAA